MATTKVKEPKGKTKESERARSQVSDSRIPSGIVGLDEVIEGGLRDHTATVIVGASGTGKSTFAMQYILEGLDRGEQGLRSHGSFSPSKRLLRKLLQSN